MDPIICALADVNAESLALVGGKGANLGELVSAGIPVPAAFCVTTAAYQRHIVENDLLPRIEAALATADYASQGSIEAIAASIRSLIIAAPMPPDIELEIGAAYSETHSGGSVSVRSSATAEDLPGTSFAGQQDTYLHISGAANVVDAVKRCWASLWTDRAVSYRHSQGFAHDMVLLAVVVQEMFPSEVSGVLFTANPVTSNPFEFFVNASWGLGEAIVSGHVNPDQLVISKSPMQITERHISDKAVMTVPDPSGQGSVTVPTPSGMRTTEALPDSLLYELCAIGQLVEDHYGFPQDIEWGWADGRFAILQAREITGADLDFGHELEAWKTPKARADMYDDRWTWSRAYSDEAQTGPSTPSFYTYLQSGMTNLKAKALEFTWTEEFAGHAPDSFLDFPYFRWYGARAYYNLAFEQERIRRFIPPQARDEATLWPFPQADRQAIRDMPFDWDEFMSLLWRLHRERYDVSLLGTTQVIYEGLERWTDEEDAFWEKFDLESASVSEIFAGQLASRQGSRFGENVILPFTIYLFMLPQSLRYLCENWLGDEDGTIYGRLLAGSTTKTGEENLALWDLSRSIRQSSRLKHLVENATGDEVLAALESDDAGRVFSHELNRFLAKHGHRGGAERDAFHPRWRHDPARVFQAIRPLLALDDDQSPALREARMHELMLVTKAEAEEHLRRQPLNELKAPFFTWFLELVQDYMYYRDFERFYNDKTMSRSRDLYEAIARRFIAAGLLTETNDVFFLGRQEMLAADTGLLTPRQIAIRVRARRRVYEKYSRTEPPKYIRGWQAFDDDQLGDDVGLKGIGASAGVVTGRARVCRELSEIANIQAGDILVTVATDPGWTAVFSMIAGVVVETGGVVAHAVMISREYGLPCVANLARACDLIPDGALITIDGRTGRVKIHESDEGVE